MKRRKTRQIQVGAVAIGGDAPISIQSMTNTDTRDVAATVAQIKRLEEAGCDIVRCAVPDREGVEALPRILEGIKIPLIADIHFDYRLALGAIAAGVQGLRLNPGNIGGQERVQKVVQAAAARDIPIRIGVNGGSLEKELLEKYGHPTPEALVESAMGHVGILENLHYNMIKISLKSSSIPLMLSAYRLLAEKTDYPLHLGVTEAGTLKKGSIKSAVGIGALLAEGIGDTIRVSLTGDPVEEIFVAREILRTLDLRKEGIEFISCPTCGRTQIDLIAIAEQVEESLKGMHVPSPITVAVMGCVVNGPGEAREADFGIAGGKGAGLLFKKGEVIKKLPEDQLVQALIAEIRHFCQEGHR
ncbi:flavodoxin-dependent (E)-4-hydroxy-3-methylbut-2-enyl-diphosphate synthase [Dehalobacterium formicoaceticum]|uniref:4-hydroxy-3-methylbut-2-en-1-yl diphosphate synthase (flavodoxin) n=1 Tax=Dehalobacterium formicoaceticum TaxID=51515 RepID=A0ABT1Y1H2_9FIRM|nr:flavodoxin-dependent (E)-4-hydroxy-3-methylbut-2-enyl-diphosphate synthase [Dehalobacterium formicoaceticum]MCR6544707.1 flavodoxin-dependent (E)-4-hydroxy-3-methylbut-2-enyl-diphosphate synthase [Dehalobacterium formicoaceticum]